ncbi:MAG: sigma-54 dependent transcriptional regulator [Treponemataceae bacterium]|nr:sigma-54 dependent transcriptional regulator [Treponemataceae bacterium]
MLQSTILIIDDEKNIREGLAAALSMEFDDRIKVELADNGKTGLERFAKGDIDLVITDLRMPEVTGEQVLAKITAENPGVPVIVLTGHGSIDSAVEAMRSGAYDFLTKPPNLDELTAIVQRALKSRELVIRNQRLESDLESKQSFESIIGKSAEMQKIFDMVRRVADSKANVLITGESGVGKELIANAIHKLSSRHDNALVKVNCAALSESLLESELFGHEKGAFTGAIAQKKGRFELADKGTIFLDEIGEINQTVQIKILRVLQERQFERVGGEDTLSVDVRVVAATNKDLEKEVAEGRFREDLFYRLNVVHIHVPPLRERKDDIPLMIQAFVKEFAEENGKQIADIDNRARSALYNYSWPGNIRQLRNFMESAVVMCQGNRITLDDLPPTISQATVDESIHVPAGISLDEAEKIVILQNLARYNNNKSKTAEVLQIGRKTLHRKLAEWGIEDDSE